MEPSAHAGTLPAPVLIVDDQPEFHSLMRMLLAGCPRLAIAAAAISGEEALSVLDGTSVRLAIVDVDMPGMHGFEAARRLRSRQPDLCVVMVSATGHPLYAEIARDAGAEAFIEKKWLTAERLAAYLPATA